MATFNLGSIQDQIRLEIDDIPSSLSGAGLNYIIDSERLFAEEYTGLSIGSVGIAERFQNPIKDLATAHLLAVMETQGADVNTIELGDLKVGKGQGSNLTVARNALREEAMRKLKEIGRKVLFFKALG